jgi:hypothetical protein
MTPAMAAGVKKHFSIGIMSTPARKSTGTYINLKEKEITNEGGPLSLGVENRPEGLSRQ